MQSSAEKLNSDSSSQLFFKTRLRSHMDTYGWSSGSSAEEALAFWDNIHKVGSTERNRRTAYIHVPFCSTLCSFCNFQRKAGTPAAAAEYAKYVIEELKWYRNSAYITQGGFTSLYLGGGTPSLIPADALAELIEYARKILDLDADAEISLESTIHDLNEDKLKKLVDAGVNRISFGVQTFDTDARKRLGRLSDRQKVRDTIELARRTGIKTLSADILYRLPGQTTGKFLEDLKYADELGLDGLSLYPLIAMDHTPLKKALQDGRISALPDIEVEHSSCLRAREYLLWAGFKQDTCTHFTRGTDRNLYGNIRLDDGDCLPIGSGAGGYVGPLVVMNNMDRINYQKQITEGKSGYMAGSLLNEKARVLRSVSGQLQKGFVNPDTIRNYWQKDILEGIRNRAEYYVNNRLLDADGRGYKLTDEGWFWAYNIAADFVSLGKAESSRPAAQDYAEDFSEAEKILNKPKKNFTLKQLSVIGVLTALVIVVQFITAIILHAIGVAAIPGVMYFATAFISSVILFVALRKVPKGGALSIIAGVYSILIMLITGSLFTGLGLLIGGLLGDAAAKITGGIQKTIPLIIALVIFRTSESAFRNLLAVVTSVTQVNWVWYLIALTIVASALGAAIGGFVGRSISGKLYKAGVM